MLVVVVPYQSSFLFHFSFVGRATCIGQFMLMTNRPTNRPTNQPTDVPAQPFFCANVAALPGPSSASSAANIVMTTIRPLTITVDEVAQTAWVDAGEAVRR